MTLGVVAAAILLGTVTSIWQAVRATRAMAVAVAERKRADKQAALATSTAESLQWLVGSINPDARKGPDYNTRQLDDFANELDEKFTGQPRAAAGMHAILGKAYACLGQRDKAREQMEKALVLSRGGFGDQNETYADLLVDRARPDSSDPSRRPELDADLRRALSIYRARGIGGERVIRRFIRCIGALRSKPTRDVSDGTSWSQSSRKLWRRRPNRRVLTSQKLRTSIGGWRASG